VDLEPSDYMTALEYLMEKEALIIGTWSGLMLLHSVDGNGTQVVGRVEGGIRCIAPSPDGDLLAVINRFGQVLVMTHDWDLLYETELEAALEDIDVRKDFFPLFFFFFKKKKLLLLLLVSWVWLFQAFMHSVCYYYLYKTRFLIV
jgi:elongator complex protein 1